MVKPVAQYVAPNVGSPTHVRRRLLTFKSSHEITRSRARFYMTIEPFDCASQSPYLKLATCRLVASILVFEALDLFLFFRL